MLRRRIHEAAPPGTAIPKPTARRPFTVKGNDVPTGEPGLICRIPSHSNPRKPYEKGVTYRRKGDQLDRAFHIFPGREEDEKR